MCVDADVRDGAIAANLGSAINLSIAGLESYFYTGWRAELVDLLVIAAAVEYCDLSVKRPAWGWARSFDLRVAVHSLDRWEDPAVHNALEDALSFLTGDQWIVSFVQRMRNIERVGQGTHVTKADVTAMMKDIMAGKTRLSEKTKKLRGRSVVRGGIGAASRTVGLLGGIFTYARDELGIIEANPAHGVRKPKDAVRTRRLNEDEYRTLGRILNEAAEDERYTRTVGMIRQIAMSGSHTHYALDRSSRKAALVRFLTPRQDTSAQPEELDRLAA